MTHITTIARITLLEARRSRLLTVMITVMLCLFILAEFLGELSITEAREIKVSVTASLLRIFSICLICLFVISSGTRELNDKGAAIILSLPLPRYVYLFGKSAGFATLSLFIAVGAGLPLMLYAPAAQVGCWILSLLFEQLLMISFSFLCLLTLPNVTLSFVSVVAFYLLSRSMETMQLLGASPLLASDSVSHEVMYFLLNALSLLLPDLHAFTRSGWLVHGIGFNDMVAVMLQTPVYLIVLTSAGLFDLYRKNL